MLCVALKLSQYVYHSKAVSKAWYYIALLTGNTYVILREKVSSVKWKKFQNLFVERYKLNIFSLQTRKNKTTVPLESTVQ